MKLPWYWMLFSLLMFSVGIAVGMLWGTYALIDHVLYGMSGVFAGSDFDVQVNFNETKFVEEINKTIIPRLVDEGKNGT